MQQKTEDRSDLPLEIEKLSIGYKNLLVAKDISLSVNTGEIFGLIGLNGVGKTTLIKTILDLRGSPQQTILIYGQNNHNTETRKQISYLPERFDATNLVVHQYEATSKDGTLIPYFIIHAKNIVLNGKNPTILYGYGGFEIALACDLIIAAENSVFALPEQPLITSHPTSMMAAALFYSCILVST